MENIQFSRMTNIAITNITILLLLVVMPFGSSLAFAQVAIDPSLELFRLRCQIDIDIDPVTGLSGPKVQIQGKARADALDGQAVSITVENITLGSTSAPSTVFTTFALGSATADWDTFPDLATPEIMFIPGNFAFADDSIQITAIVTATGQSATLTGTCADKTGAQFKQDTKGQCTLTKVLKGACKEGDRFTTTDSVTGTTTVHTLISEDPQIWDPPLP